MPSYTVTKSGYNSASGTFTWADSNINVELTPSEPIEPVEYTYTYPTGKQVHIEVSGSGYTTLSTNVTLNENRTVTADLINGTITGGDVAKVTLTLADYVGSGAWGGEGTGTVNGISFSHAGSYGDFTPPSFEVNPGESCTITATTGSGSNGVAIQINGTTVAENSPTATYTFTPTENCTVNIGYCTEPW